MDKELTEFRYDGILLRTKNKVFVMILSTLLWVKSKHTTVIFFRCKMLLSLFWCLSTQLSNKSRRFLPRSQSSKHQEQQNKQATNRHTNIHCCRGTFNSKESNLSDVSYSKDSDRARQRAVCVCACICMYVSLCVRVLVVCLCTCVCVCILI